MESGELGLCAEKIRQPLEEMSRYIKPGVTKTPGFSIHDVLFLKLFNSSNMKTITSWQSGFVFNSQFKNNTIVLDDPPATAPGDSGFSPKALLLSGLAACSGIDVVSILTKMKAPFKRIRIETVAEQTDGHPRVFKEIHITYFVSIPANYEIKVKRAVDLSLEKYCGVAAMLRKHCVIIPKVVIE